jgi:rhodanese-related sulfurtransferase
VTLSHYKSTQIAFFLNAVLYLFGSNATAQQGRQAALDATVPSLSPIALAVQMRGGGRILLYDVREREEFAVSRIPGAVQIAPSTPAEPLVARIAGRAQGVTVIFYCTVGMRSATLAQGIYHDLLERGVRDVLVLNGGIIAWHNQGLPLVDKYGPSRYLHPFHEDLKIKLKNPELARVSSRDAK